MDNAQPKVVVVTGAPGGGKDGILNWARELPWFREHALVEDEAAAWVIDGQRMKDRMGFTFLDGRIAFQQAVAATQRLKFVLAMAEARRRGLELILLNRHIADGGAYLGEGLDELELITGMSIAEMMSGIHHVIWLDSPSERFYVRTDTRLETYEESVGRGLQVRRVYESIGPVDIVHRTEDFDDKRTAFMTLLRGYLPEIP